jgi:hypothetical protein
MLSIYAPTKFHEFIQETIQKEERLDELIQIKDYLDYRPIPSGHNIMVKKDAIFPLLDWYNLLPPYLLPEEFELNTENLLGIIFAKLNNYEKVQTYLQEGNPTLYAELDFINRLQQGLSIDPETLPSSYSPFEEYRLMHNQAIIRHYSPNSDGDWDKVKYFYLEAVQAAPNEEYRAFSAKHFATLLIDLGDTADAQRLIQAILNSDISKEAKVELKQLICQVWMQELSVPYDEAMLQQLKDTLWEVLQTYEEQGRSREQALLLTDAGIIANYSESWSESLGYFNQALDIFDKEQLPEMSAHVHYRKGTLLFTWAQKGMPQFYRSAAESYQKAVKIFSKDVAPEIYAEIQHHLGIIYSEIPDEVKKKSIWAAVSSTAFAESLEFFTKESYPYDYASVCNHYANALTKYPEAKLSNNLDKALYYYQEALSIRTANAYPLERCLTLFNYLEAQWNLGMPEDRFEEERYEDMMAKAKEILVLTEDPKLIIEANQHLEKLAFLKSAYIQA